jgi:hypothetical protein
MRKKTHLISLLLCAVILVGACTTNQQQGAAKGAGVGALAGAAGSMMTALVFGGNVGEAAARGAVYGASAGAVGGAVAGSSKDKAEAQQLAAEQQKELDKLRKKIGDDTFSGIQALVQCKHEVALAYGKTAAKSDKYKLSGLWLQALTLEDQGNMSELNQLAPEIISADSRIKSTEQAVQILKDYKQGLQQIRAQFDLPETC